MILNVQWHIIFWMRARSSLFENHAEMREEWNNWGNNISLPTKQSM